MKAKYSLGFKISICAGLMLALGSVYGTVGLLPGDLKSWAEKKIHASFGKKILFDKIIYVPFRGFTLYNLVVLENTDDLLFAAKEATVDVRWLPFFTEKKIVMRQLLLDGPVYDLSLSPEPAKAAPENIVKTKISGQINVPALPRTKKIDLSVIEQGPDALLPENVYLEAVQIHDGFVSIRQNPKGPVLEQLDPIQLRMSFKKPPVLDVDGFIRLGQDGYASIKLQGTWNLKSALHEFNLTIDSTRVPEWLVRLQANDLFRLKAGVFNLNLQYRSPNEKQAQFTAKAHLKNSWFQINHMQAQGEVGIESQGEYDFEKRSFNSFKGMLQLVKINLLNLSKDVPEIRDISGRVRFAPDILVIDSAKAVYKNLPLEAKGRIESFSDPVITLTLSSESSIDKILPFLPSDFMHLLEDYLIMGDCRIQTFVGGALKSPDKFNLGFGLNIQNGQIKKRSDPSFLLNNLRGDLAVDDSKITIKGASAMIGNESYRLEAVIPKNSLTAGSIEIHSGRFDLSTAYTLQNNTAILRNAKFQSGSLKTRFNGKCFNIGNPYLAIQGEVDTELNGPMPCLDPESFSLLKNLNVKGRLKGYFIFKGPVKSFSTLEDLNLKVDAQGDEIVLKNGARLIHPDLQIRWLEKTLDVPSFSASFYGGKLWGAFQIKLISKSSPFECRLYAHNIQLEPLVHDIDIPNKDLSGTAALQIALSGILANQESFKGSGTLDVREGHLWKTDLFKAMGHLPFTKVEGLDLVTFDNLSAAFQVADKRIFTDNLRLGSPTVDLGLKGSIGFDQSLDLVMRIQFSKGVIDGAYETGGLAPLFVTQAEDFISDYKIRGTLKEPQYEKIGAVVGRAIGKKLTGVIKSLV